MTDETSSDPLQKLGMLLIHNLIDKSIEQHDLMQSGKLRGNRIQELQSRLAELTPGQRNLVRQIVIDALHVGLHDLLQAFQEAHDSGIGIEIVVDGTNAAEVSGMLHGEPLGPDGWIARFSRFPRVNQVS